MPATGPTLVAVLLLIVPGIIVVAAGWGLRRIGPLLVAPAVSVAVYGTSAVIAPWLGLGWSLLPPALVTVVAAVAAFLVRRWVGPADEVHTPIPAYAWTLGALALTSLILVAQFAFAFVSPEAIAQRFDNIVHLNSIRYALDTSNASAFHIGDTSDIGFYPNGWHAFTSLTALLSGADVATAVNAANLAVVAIVWPASNVALASALFRDRGVAMVAAAALSTGFGAFPALFFDWGVLYPNALGYSVVPAALAAVVWLVGARTPAVAVRDALLLVLLVAGMTLAHPNALLAWLLFGVLLAVGLTIVAAIDGASRRLWLRSAIIAAVGAVAWIGMWMFARTSAEHSPWPPFQNIPQAVGSGLLVSPRGYAPTILIVALLILGFVAVARRPRLLPIAAPFASAVFLFVLVSGFPIDHPLRLALTNPWYSDPNRIAALLPMTAIPVMVCGVVWLVDAVQSAASESRTPRWVRARATATIAAALATALLFTVAYGSSVREPLVGVRAAYSDDIGYAIVSADERALIDRLPQHVPADALIIGSPRTGASLAYALADRQVTEMHIFGDVSADEAFLDAHLSDIEDDPRVCAAINRLGVDFVLDLGTYDVSGDDDPRGYAGVTDLAPSDHLVLVDAEGPDARLFRIEGC